MTLYSIELLSDSTGVDCGDKQNWLECAVNELSSEKFKNLVWKTTKLEQLPKMTTQRPTRIHVFSHPRSNCHLFYRLLEGHPEFQATETVPELAAHLCGSDSQSPMTATKEVDEASGIPEDQRNTSWQEFLDEIQKQVADAESKV